MWALGTVIYRLIMGYKVQTYDVRGYSRFAISMDLVETSTSTAILTSEVAPTEIPTIAYQHTVAFNSVSSKFLITHQQPRNRNYSRRIIDAVHRCLVVYPRDRVTARELVKLCRGTLKLYDEQNAPEGRDNEKAVLGEGNPRNVLPGTVEEFKISSNFGYQGIFHVLMQRPPSQHECK